MTFLDYLLNRKKPEPKPKRLVYELAELKATSEERAAARQAEQDRRQQEYVAQNRERGKRAGESQYADYRQTILKQAALDDDFDQYEIQIAYYERSKELDDYTDELCNTLYGLFMMDGLDVDLVWEEIGPGEGSYYASDCTRYSAKLVLKW
jgi:hypothetical protein